MKRPHYTRYQLPHHLSRFQKQIYTATIDWKMQHICRESGYTDHLRSDGTVRRTYNDATFPPELLREWTIPPMIYPPLQHEVELMQRTHHAYAYHTYAFHTASSQTACVNFFLPLLLSSYADSLLKPVAPRGFHHLDRSLLYHGFQFEYGATDLFPSRRGPLGDCWHGTGTDADLAIAYINTEGNSCLWLIEHKLTETEFNPCGGFSSRYNQTKEQCKQHNLEQLLQTPSICHYHQYCHFHYIDILRHHPQFYRSGNSTEGCPFRRQLNQLWRNQLLAFALEDAQVFQRVTCSVVKHPGNTQLDNTINEYLQLIRTTTTAPPFSSFNYNHILQSPIIHQSTSLIEWAQWFQKVYAVE